MNWIILLFFSSLTLASGETPYGFVLDGVLYDTPSGTTTLLDTGTIRVQILNPAKNCVLYDEQQSFDTTASDGAFSLSVGTAVGSGRRVAGSDQGNSMTTVFQNRTASITGDSCSYSPSAGDGRYVRVFVTPSGTGVTDQLYPEMFVGSVPTAIVAESLQGIDKTGFLRLGAQALTQTNLEHVFTTANYSTLDALLTGGGSSTGGSSASSYVINSGTGGSGGINFNTNGSTRASIAYNGDFTVGSNSLFVNGTTGKVGLGTNSTTYDFSLGGAISRAIGMERNDTSNTSGNTLTIASGGATSGATDKAGGDLYLSSGTATGSGSSNIYLQTASAGAAGTADRAPSTKMTILGNGNVGIGTAAPGEKLEVAGNLKLTGVTHGITFPDGTTQTTAAGGGSGGTMLSQWPDAVRCTNGSQYWHFVLANGPWSDGRYYYSGATEWIGFNTDGSYYSSSGGLSGYDCVTSAQSISTLYSLGRAYNFVGGGSNLWTASGSDTFFGGGNVGIGTTNPQSKLDVSGVIRAEQICDEAGTNCKDISTGWGGGGGGDFMANGSVPMTGVLHNTKSAGVSQNGTAVEHTQGDSYSGTISAYSSSAGDTTAPFHAALFGSTNNKKTFALIGERRTNSTWTNAPNAVSNGTYLPGIGFAGQTGSTAGAHMTLGASVGAVVNGTVSVGVLPTDLIFSTSTTNSTGLTEHMRVTSAGNVGIGTTNPQATLHVNGTLRVDTLSAATATQVCIDGNNVLSACSSSIRYKENVRDLSPSLETVLSLRPVSYDWIRSKEHDVGFIAEEVEKIDSRLVTYNKQGRIQGVKYDQLASPIVKAIQELYHSLTGTRREVAGLAEENRKLRQENARMKARLERIEKKLGLE